MRSILLLSVNFLPLVLGIALSKDRKAKRGLKRVVVMSAVFFVLWSIVGSALFFVLPAK